MLFALPTKCDHKFFSCSFPYRFLNLNISCPIITQLLDSEVFHILFRSNLVSISLSEPRMNLVCISYVHLNDICVPNAIKTNTGVSKLRTHNFCSLIFYLRYRDRSVLIARIRLKSGVRFQAEANFSLLHNVRTRSETHSACYPMCTSNCLAEGTIVGA